MADTDKFWKAEEGSVCLRIPQSTIYKLGQVTNTLQVATDREPTAIMQQRLLDLYPNIIPSLSSALEARCKDRMEGIQKLLTERSEYEIRSIESVLNELASSIRQELDEPEDLQLELFSSEEKEQLNRNMDALQRRLAAIPGEIEQEKTVILKRFSDPQMRMFPVAVMFLVPEKYLRG